jgi:hypothetical protein
MSDLPLDNDTFAQVGWTYRAWLKFETPLAVLENHGREVPLDGIRMEYGPPEQGEWRARYAAGSPMAGFNNMTWPTPVGLLPEDGADFLPFLKAYRAVIESAAPVVDRVERVKQLVGEPAYARFTRALPSDLPTGWLATAMVAELGVPKKAARTLLGLGYLDATAVLAASDDALRGLPGIGPKTLAQIRIARGLRSGAP